MADPLRSEAYRRIVFNLRAAREASGMHQAALARAMGKDKSYISRIENAERRIGVLDLIRIARALGVDPNDLFAEIIKDIPGNLDG